MVTSLRDMRMREMDLDGVMDLIKAEASLWMPRHQRRMALLKVRKTGTQDDFFQ